MSGLLWIACAMALGCGPVRTDRPTRPPGAAAKAPPVAELWTKCEAHFNRRELDDLERCFDVRIDFIVGTVLGAGRRELRGRLADLIKRNPEVRLSTNLAMHRNDVIAAVVVIEGWGDEPSARLGLVVAALDDGALEALRLHLDPFIPGRRARSLVYPALGQVRGRALTDDQLRWVAALSERMSRTKQSGLPLAPDGVVHHPRGDIRGEAVDSLLREYADVTAVLGYRAIPVLAAGDWVVVEGEWRDREGSFRGRLQGMLARVVEGTAREIWLFDPMTSASSFANGLENLPPRH